MDKTKKLKTRLKILIATVLIVVLSLAILLIVQNVQLHNLYAKETSQQQELSELEKGNDLLDKKIEELSSPTHIEDYYAQENNYGTENDYIFG